MIVNEDDARRAGDEARAEDDARWRQGVREWDEGQERLRRRRILVVCAVGAGVVLLAWWRLA